jgi:outer membrane murein-binding lipoprotein Lpp
MNSKLILSGVLAVVLLSGCASAPQAPRDAKEVADLGDETCEMFLSI